MDTIVVSIERPVPGTRMVRHASIRISEHHLQAYLNPGEALKRMVVEAKKKVDDDEKAERQRRPNLL